MLSIDKSAPTTVTAPTTRTSQTVRVAGLLVAVLVLVAALAAAATGCGKKNPQNPSQARTGQAPNAVKRSPVEPAIPVAVETAKVGPIASYYAATATLTAEKEAEVLARVTGIVESLEAEEGDVVRKGDVLLHIEDHEYRLRLRQAEANRANLEDRHNRLKGMFEQQLVSAQEYEAVKNELKSAEAAEELARLELSYATVRAPFTGRIVRRMVDVGRNVSVGTPLFVVSDFDPLLAVVHVPSKEFKRLKPNQPVELILDSNKQRLQGRIRLVSPVIDPTSGTIKVTVEIPEFPAGTRPGDFAEVRIVTDEHPQALLVPKEAVFTDRGDRVVYVAADSTAERRVVDVGFEDDVHAEILSGVSAGERVVVKGQRSLKHGSTIKVLANDALASRPARGNAVASGTETSGDSARADPGERGTSSDTVRPGSEETGAPLDSAHVGKAGEAGR